MSAVYFAMWGPRNMKHLAKKFRNIIVFHDAYAVYIHQSLAVTIQYIFPR